ncbi:EI24 domain-containing protein [Microbacterium oryzae]|uniref:EI24 domain-containing protein n=1 Tax=Microbacterium oryzae TaxID=743009 RepID=UPI0025B20AE2|nr:EI24 domain-containing protein [Microbacterium oryzae]MDN3309880.1 EI24 domain-containing protein [Microbacterium oryzae]
MREFWAGVRTLGRGFGWWRRRPRVMAAALLPAALVGAALTAGLIVLGAFLPEIVASVTPWADGWASGWAAAIRLLVGAALLAGAVVLAVATFTALSLFVGEPFYDRVWRSVESAQAEAVPDAGYGMWRAAGDAISLVLRGLGIAMLTLAVGFVPVAGAVLAAVLGATFSGWMLADELTARALTARGLGPVERRALRRASRARVLGFGVATHLCLLVPLGAVIAMPAAVAGSTLLAHTLLERAQDSGTRG